MTGSIHHHDRPECVEPEPIGRYPCHPAIAVLEVGDRPITLCDAHAVEVLRDHLEDDVITRVDIIDDHGGTRPWWIDEIESTPDLRRAYRYCSRAYVDYGCCLPGQVDPAKLKAAG